MLQRHGHAVILFTLIVWGGALIIITMYDAYSWRKETKGDERLRDSLSGRFAECDATRGSELSSTVERMVRNAAEAEEDFAARREAEKLSPHDLVLDAHPPLAPLYTKGEEDYSRLGVDLVSTPFAPLVSADPTSLCFSYARARGNASVYLKESILFGSVVDAMVDHMLEDHILEVDGTGGAKRSTLPRVFVAANWHALPGDLAEAWVTQLLALIARLGRDKVYVSIYESGSAHGVTRVVLAELGRCLSLLGVPHSIVMNDRKKTGGKEHRIDFLAGVRNKALRPLLQPAGKESGSYDRVLFVNDVLFCADDAITLITSPHEDSPMACGLDLYDGLFYDIWVATDISGTPFVNRYPYIKHPDSAAAVQENRPFRATCCWNGMVAYDASLHVEHGIRFRTAYENECAEGECELFCRDVWKATSAGAVVYPHVRTGYKLVENPIHLYDISEILKGAADIHKAPSGIDNNNNNNNNNNKKVVDVDNDSDGVEGMGWEHPAFVRCCPLLTMSTSFRTEDCVDVEWDVLLGTSPATTTPTTTTTSTSTRK